MCGGLCVMTIMIMFAVLRRCIPAGGLDLTALPPALGLGRFDCFSFSTPSNTPSPSLLAGKYGGRSRTQQARFVGFARFSVLLAHQGSPGCESDLPAVG